MLEKNLFFTYHFRCWSRFLWTNKKLDAACRLDFLYLFSFRVVWLRALWLRALRLRAVPFRAVPFRAVPLWAVPLWAVPLWAVPLWAAVCRIHESIAVGDTSVSGTCSDDVRASMRYSIKTVEAKLSDWPKQNCCYACVAMLECSLVANFSCS